MTSLPPLPPPHATSFYANPLFSDDQMRAYAAQAVAAERDPQSVIARALLLAATLPRNQDKPASAVRAAAVELFGQEAVDAAMQVWRT